MICLHRRMRPAHFSYRGDETDADVLLDAIAAETENKRADKVKKLQNATFYLIKLLHGENVLNAIRRTSPI
jgi:hypothetical protein